MISALVIHFFIQPQEIERFTVEEDPSLLIKKRTSLQKFCIFLIVAGELAMYGWLFSTIPHSFYEKHRALVKVLGSLALLSTVAAVYLAITSKTPATYVWKPPTGPDWNEYISKGDEHYQYWENSRTGEIRITPPDYPRARDCVLQTRHINGGWEERVIFDGIHRYIHTETGGILQEMPAGFISAQEIQEALNRGTPILKRCNASSDELPRGLAAESGSSAAAITPTPVPAGERVQEIQGDWMLINSPNGDYYRNKITNETRSVPPLDWKVIIETQGDWNLAYTPSESVHGEHQAYFYNKVTQQILTDRLPPGWIGFSPQISLEDRMRQMVFPHHRVSFRC